MNTQLQQLIECQDLDSKINQLEERTRKIPESIEELNETLEESRKELEASEMLQGKESARKRELESEVEALRVALAKYKTQLMEVKTNKQYQAMVQEITNAEAEIGKKEDEVLEAMMAIDEAEQAVEKAKQGFQQKEKEILKKCSALDQFASEAQTQVDGLQREKSHLQAQIPEGLSQQYEQIATARNGVALAEAKDQSCQGCHVKLRPQLFAELKTNREIIRCENCNRFLYWAGLPGE
ncbi:MAG: C4-type zinc ribbon domain-containing protein [Acidobacteriota bacterium]